MSRGGIETTCLLPLSVDAVEVCGKFLPVGPVSYTIFLYVTFVPLCSLCRCGVAVVSARLILETIMSKTVR